MASDQGAPAAPPPEAPAAPDAPVPDTSAGTTDTSTTGSTVRGDGTVPAGPGPAAARGARQRAGRQPLRRLTVLFDPQCRLCAFASRWLSGQRQLVPLDLVPVGSPEALRRFPELDQRAAAKEITVVGDAGQLYRGDSAWIVCLWALAEHRELSHTLTSPAGRRLARAAVLSAAKYREVQGWQPARGGTSSETARGGTLRRPARGGTHESAPVWGGQPVRPSGWSARPGAPMAGRPRPGAPPTGSAPPAPAWVYDGSGGWTQVDPAPTPAPARAPAPPAGPPGWTYDEVTGWTQGDTGPEDCADGCSPSG